MDIRPENPLAPASAGARFQNAKPRQDPIRQHVDLHRQVISFVESVEYYAVFMLDEAGYICSWNPGVASIFGYTAEQFIGMDSSLLFIEEERAAGVHVQERQAALENGSASDVRWHLRKDGSRIWADGLLTAIRTPDGELRSSFIKIMRDATVQKKAQDSLKIREEDLAHANHIKDVFIATLSHELRNPLNIIMGFTEILKDELASAGSTQMEAIEAIERSAHLQNQLVNDLLDMSRIMSGKFAIERQPIDIRPILESILKSVKISAQKKDIQLHSNLTVERGVKIDGDAGRLQQVIMNIVNNAIKFTPEGGRIDVTLAVDPEAKLVHLAVKDTGKGISPQFLPYVFDRFRQQQGGATQKYGGLGLGLSIARELVELHGGCIYASSEGEGCGATFMIHLPYTS